MEKFTDAFGDLTEAAAALAAQLMTLWLPLQLGTIVLAALLAGLVALLVRRRVDTVGVTMGWPAVLRAAVRAVVNNLGAIAFIMLVGFARVAMLRVTAPANSYLLSAAVNLAVAWLVIAILASVIHNRFVKRLVAFTAWTIAALSILGLLDEVSRALDSVAITLAGLRITPLLVLKTTLLLILALWAALAVGNALEKRLAGSRDLTPSLQVLIGKLMRLTLVVFAVVIVASSIGLDLSALALFSGAVGVGIGLGLQKIVSNFVSGIILLVDKSVKPGDVISVGDSFGWVVSMNTRHVAVTRRDGREILIPNEDLITSTVINWSYSKDEIRVDLPFPADVGSDPKQVRRAALEAVSQVERVLKTPAPVCHFVGFSSASLDFLLRFWISDPEAGVTNIRSAVLIALWDILKREGIMIPSPIQDLRLRGTTKLAAMLPDELPPDKEKPRREHIP
jgi:small-conductance mechanosensitive channel